MDKMALDQFYAIMGIILGLMMSGLAGIAVQLLKISKKLAKIEFAIFGNGVQAQRDVFPIAYNLADVKDKIDQMEGKNHGSTNGK